MREKSGPQNEVAQTLHGEGKTYPEQVEKLMAIWVFCNFAMFGAYRG
jgi:hypothetical protein